MKRIFFQNEQRKRKKEVRDFLFSLFADMELQKIVGLAGPDIQDYLSYCKLKGFSEFEIYEKNGLVAMHQLIHLKDGNIQLKLKDVIEAEANEPNTLYDLDFCATVRYLQHHIAKFKERFIMTFCLRVSKEETINTFFSVRQETILEFEEFVSPMRHTLYKTNEGKYIYVPYKDTITMCCIAKIS